MRAFLWGMLSLYVLGRISQLYAGRIPSLLIVILHVVPPALLAIAHGSVLHRWKGIAVFTCFCVGIGTFAETVSLRTGFPFGSYYFTGLMGPKILQLPVLLALAYLGIGYAAWVPALLILGYADKPLRGARISRIAALPLLAAFIMLAWDLAMDPVWSKIEGAWVWEDGGAYFGVPVANFAGWFVTAFLYYLAFTLYCRTQPASPARVPSRFWLPAILTYAVCALGNLLLLTSPRPDAAGGDILRNCALVSLVVMLPFAAMAWLRLRRFSADLSPS